MMVMKKTRYLFENLMFSLMIKLIRIWATRYMDQWEQVKFNTPYGMIYVSIRRDTIYPDSYDDLK